MEHIYIEHLLRVFASPPNSLYFQNTNFFERKKYINKGNIYCQVENISTK